MANVWAPEDTSQICPRADVPLAACSPSAMMYLTLLTRLYGAATISLPDSNPYSSNNESPIRFPKPSPPGNDGLSYPETAQDSKQNGNTGKRRKKRQSHGYDFIVVGGGSAGCVVANRLSEITSWRILLIEAGPEEPDVTSVPALPPALRWSSIDWNYGTQPEKLTCRGSPGGRCHWARGKTLGGSSATNYLIYIRGNRLDYDNWAALGNPGWSYREVLPYFRKSENNRDIEGKDTYYHGVGGPLNVGRFPYTDANTIMLVEAFNETGLPIVDLNAENNIGTQLGQSTSIDGRRWSANMAYLRPIRDVRPNIDIMVNAFVTKIIIDPKTKVAQGVTYFRNGVYQNVYARKEVIVSGGSINSPKLLMLSGIGPRRHLRSLHIPVISDLQVGQNLQDHATADGLIIGLSNKTSTQVSGPELLNQVNEYYQQPLHEKSGPMSSTSTLNAIGFIKTNYSQVNAPDIQMLFDGQNVEDLYADPPIYTQLPVFPLAFYNSIAARPFLLTPRSRGQILLNRTNPVFGQPLIYPGFFTVKNDVDVLVAGMRYIITLEQTEAFRKNGAYFVRKPIRGCEQYEWGTYDYYFCLLVQYTSTIYHPVGTCKMGPASDKTAVVDARLRVYGVKGLRVIDGSIMPQIVRGNTNAPIIMIGERASDFIKEDYQILLIEAGPEEPDVTSVPALPPALRWSSIDWNYGTQPEKLTCRGSPGGRCHWARGKTLGGSSATNYLIYIRGNRLDYDNWAALGNPGWSYKEVLPYFRKSENNRDIEGKDTYYHGVGGPLNVGRFSYTDANTIMLVEAFNETGLPIVDLNAENNIGTQLGQSTAINGRRWSANMAYLRPIRDVRPNIDIMVNAFVTKIIIDPKTKVAQGVTYFRNGVFQNVYARKEVIVSGGSINSPKLLMVSGIGPRRHLRSLHIPVISDLQVGQNLQDHATADGLIIGLSNKTSTQVSGPELLNQVKEYYQQPLHEKSGPMSSTGTLNAIGFIKTNYSLVNAPDIQMLFDGQNVEDLFADPPIYSQLPVFPVAFYNSIAARPFLLTPRSRGQILLNRTNPVFGQPLIYPGFFTVKNDVDVLVAGMRYIITLEQTEAFRKNGAYFVRKPIRGCEQYEWGTYDYYFCLLVQYTSTIYHPVGTCKMGPASDKTAVVDARLRVYGVKGLRVIDGSIMPQIVRGNTNAPIIMIGERASDFIKEDYQVLNK